MAAEAAKDQRSGDEVKASLLATLKSKIETLGEKNGETLEAMHHLAYFLKSHEEYDEAEELLQKAITISEELIGKDDGQTLFSMGCLAIVYSEHGKYAEAETLQQQILETKERVLGKDHPDSLVCRERLAWTLHSQGKYQKCRDLYPPPPKEQDPNVITAVMDDTSRLDEAEKIYIGSMELKERVLGEEHPETLKSMAELASWFSDKCKRVQAERLYRRVLKLRERVLRPDNEVTLATKRKLAQVLSESGKYLEAEKTLRELLEVQEKALGHDNPKVLKTMGALPMVLKALGKLDDAEKTLQQLVALKSNLHGEDHLDTLESMDDLAIILAEQERYAKAEGVFRRITEIRKKTLGANDPKTLRSLSYLALMLEKQDKHEQADEILEQQALASEEEEAEADTEEAEGKAEEAGPKTEDAEAKAKAADPKTEEEAEVKAKQGVGDARKEPGFFKYKPLKSTRSTRVIDLYPSRYKSAALVIGLREVELDENDPPSYAAISYSVDRQKADKRVFCHGKKFMVSKNVEDVLRQFRQPEKMSWLWIDAISISQTSTKERNQQILLMEDIYRLAEVVAVWLGPSTELTEAAFEYFTAVARKHYYHMESDDTKKKPVNTKALSMEILGRSWFTRMWCVQEVGMSSPGAAKLCCGEEMIEWETFARALGTGSVPNVPASARDAIQIFYRLETLFSSVRASSRNPGSVGPQNLLRGFTPLAGVLEILVEIRGRASTDPRDKVFALHGILTAFEANFPNPSYDKPAEQVFRETAEAVVRHDTRNMHILYHVSSQNRMPDLPSWAPDWSDPDVVANDADYRFWHASRYSFVDCTFSNSTDGATMLCSGKIIDKISNRARALREELDVVDDIEVFKGWISCVKPLAKAYSSIDAFQTAFYWTLVQLPWNDDGLEIPLSKKLREVTSPEAFDAWAGVITHKGPASERPVLEGVGETFHENIRARLSGHSLFITEKQRMGTAWNTIQEGDVVALLSGVEMPMILRPVKDTYRVVTWAYIDGIMDGESWPADDHLDTITLV